MGCIVSPRRGRVGTTYIFFQYTLPVLLRIAVACQLARASASLARSAMISIKGTRAPTLLAMPRRRTSVRLKNTSSEGHASMGDLSRFGPPALTRSSLSFFRRSFHLLRIPRDSVMASVMGGCLGRNVGTFPFPDQVSARASLDEDGEDEEVEQSNGLVL